MITYGTEKVPIGSQIKMAINFAYKGTALTLDDIDDIVFTYYSPLSKSGGVVLTKLDLIRRETTVGQNTTVEWAAIVDTSLVGQGLMKLKVDAMIPDGEASRYRRREIEICETNVTII